MKLIIAFLGIVFLSSGQETSLKLDAVHSYLGFTIGHLGVSEIGGSFKMNEGAIIMKGEDFTDAEISLTIDINSIDTDNDKRDNHLREADFFDGEKYPEGKFKSTSCKKSGDQKYIVTGEFTMHGITKLIKLDMTTKSGINPSNNKPIHGIKATCTIKRTDFEIATSTPVEILSDEVAIIAYLEFKEE